MPNEYFGLAPKKKAILAGLYLAKFDEEGLQWLGFDRFREAYNAFGFALNEKPKNIQNYRDEFDPEFPNPGEVAPTGPCACIAGQYWLSSEACR